MKTESQAELMWCPMVRAVGDGCGGDNCYILSNGAAVRIPEYARCIGSQCAMWRWGDPVRRRFRTAANETAETEADAGPLPEALKGWEFHPYGDDPAGWVEPEASAQARRRGYCGLAGRPR